MIKKRIVRTLVIWLFTSLWIFQLGRAIPNFFASDIMGAMLTAVILGLMNAVLWPLLSRYTTSYLFIFFVIGSLLFNGLAIWAMSFFHKGISIEGIGILVIPFLISIMSTLLSGLFTIDDDASYYRSVVNKTKKHESGSNFSTDSGIIFLEIDGLSESILKKAIIGGHIPTLAEWVTSGKYKIKGWETDLSSQSGSSQAGILHGNNSDIPAFRWVDKKNGNKIVSANGIGDIPKIEAKISNGNGLLAINGSAIADLFSGDAVEKFFVYSKFNRVREIWSDSWRGFYSVPYNIFHTVALMVWDMVHETLSRYRQWRKNIVPRLSHRGLTYFFGRAGANVFLREISTYRVIYNIIIGEKDAIYTTFFGYDEIAHHCGVDDEESFYALKKIDRCIRRIDHAREYSKRPYCICVLSDHGQTKGATFKQRYGLGLNDLVESLLPKGRRLYCELNSNQDHFGQMVSVPVQSAKLRVTRTVKGKEAKNVEAIVLASGNLGLIYFTSSSERMSLEQIDGIYPELIKGLVSHPGIGFIMVDTNAKGSVVIGPNGKYHLADDRVEGENPLTKYGKNAPLHLKRTDTFRYVPDILVMSMYDPEKQEVAAFEELIGSHGGLGGDQSKPFILYPAEWNFDESEIVGAEQVFWLLKKQIANGKENLVSQ